MTGILEKPTTNSSGGQCTLFVLCSQYVLQQFWVLAGFQFWVPPGLMSVAGFEMEDGWI
jgi:hypothetical protein